MSARLLTALVAIVAIVGGGLAATPAVAAPAPAAATASGTVAQAAAVTGADFDPGYIISDYLFYNTGAMTQAQIQTFLDGKCTTNNCIDNVKTTTSTRAATNMCPATYTGASNETTAAIIYKVQKSCGISAKVILVTLQKEQGLVTLQNPSALKLRKAMGYGCPDTSVCDSNYYGLFNQIYSAASQLKRYGLRTSDNLSFRTKYQIGIPYNIALHPSATCGTKKVTVRNKATTALYYYTPYTPNPQALANLAGTGNSCSSYGNRNFWRYYNSWFGSTLLGQGQEAINLAVENAGGSSVLGAAGTTTCVTTSTKCFQNFANGGVYWAKSTGAFAVNGTLNAAFVQAGGPTGALGYPTASSVSMPSTPSGPGIGQVFSGGTIYGSAAGAFAVPTAIRTRYQALGSYSGASGWPTAAYECLRSVCSQEFEHSVIFASGTAWAREVAGDEYKGAWLASGGRSGPLDYPTGSMVNVTVNPNGAGTGQSFTTGTIYSSAAGVFAVFGVVRTEYWRLGSNSGKFGWPTSAAVCTGGLCAQDFQGGSVLQVSATKAASLTPEYKSVHSAWASSIGTPSGVYVDVTSNPNGKGAGQAFTTGTIYSSAAGAFPVFGAVRTEYWRVKSNAGLFGWPVADPVCTDGLCSQQFQGGTIGQVSATVTRATPTPYATVAAAYANELGTPLTSYIIIAVNKNGAGGGQTYSKGTIYSSKAGAFPVWGNVRAAYLAKGGNGGAYGWPIANPVCKAGVCTQKFQKGTITK
ncbi:MAG: hypothetical protein ACOH10_10490 [Rhodoglobus sp.]